MKIIAHRGFSSRAPENTMSAFEIALEFGVDGLELDVQLSKDGELVVCHDELLDRTTNGSGLLKDYTLEELKELDAGGWYSKEYGGEKIPTLREVLDLVKGKDLLLNIELKSGVISYPGIEEKTVSLVKEYGLVDNTIISSFNHYSLVEIKKVMPEMAIGILYMEGLYEPWDYAEKLQARALHPYFYNIVPEIVKGAKERGLLLNPFTVDEPRHIAMVVDAQVDGIITNYPDRVRQYILSRGNSQ